RRHVDARDDVACDHASGRLLEAHALSAGDRAHVRIEPAARFLESDRRGKGTHHEVHGSRFTVRPLNRWSASLSGERHFDACCPEAARRSAIARPLVSVSSVRVSLIVRMKQRTDCGARALCSAWLIDRHCSALRATIRPMLCRDHEGTKTRRRSKTLLYKN